MEINIRLAGVQLGPYSEKQIREYLQEGLVSPEDLACEAGTDDWIPVNVILAKSQPEESEAPTAPPAMADAVFEDPEPMEPIRAPEPVTDEPVEAMAKRTLMIGPTAPSRRPGKSPTASSTVTTAPLSSQSSTKQISRSSIVKGLGAKTAPLPSRATIPINVPPRPPTTPDMLPSPANTPPPAEAPSPAPPIPEGTTMPPKKGGLPAILQSLTAKTAPMRSAPPTPPPRSNLPITTPLPTRPIPVPIRAEPPVTELPESRPPAAPETPTEKLRPPPSSPQTETVFDPAKSNPPARFSAKKKSPAPDPGLVPVEEAPAKTARAARKKFPVLLIGSLILAIIFGYYVYSPYHAASLVSEALRSGTPASLDASVDFDSVRTSLKDQFKNQVLTTAHDARAAAAALDVLNHSVDLYVTPEGISGLAGKTGQFSKDAQAQSISQDVAANLLSTWNSQPIRSSGLASLTDFVMKSDVAMLHLQLSGLKWKLKRVQLRPDLSAPANGAVASPLLRPVIDTYLGRGADLAKQGDWNGAMDNFSQVLALDPNSTAAYIARGGARQSSGDLDGANKDFTQAIALNPQLADAFIGRGNVRTAKKDFDGAIADFTAAVKIDPTLATAYDARGNARTAKNDLDGAIADYSQAITIDPTLASAFSDRGIARQANGNLDGAISDYNQAIALKPKTASAYYNRGLARQSHGDLDAAILDFGHALSIDPKNAGAYYNRATAKLAQKDIDGAIADLSQALAINPRNALAYSNRGVARQALGDVDGAISDYTQALAIDPKIAPAYYNRGLIRGQTNDPDGAIADASHSLDLDPKNNQAYYNRAYAKLLKGNLDGAQDDFKQFCDVAPHIPYADNARLYLWLIAKAQSSKLDADQALTEALENNWNSTADDFVTKTASYLLGRSSEAEYLASAASTDPKVDQGQHCEAFYFAGMHRLLLGDKPAAMDFFRKSVATGQKDYCEYSLAQAELQGLAPAVPAPAGAPAPTIAPARAATP